MLELIGPRKFLSFFFFSIEFRTFLVFFIHFVLKIVLFRSSSEEFIEDTLESLVDIRII